MKQDPNPPTDSSPSNIEQQLLPRLKFMGLLLFFFSGCALIYALFFATNIPPEVVEALATDQLTTPAEMQQSAGFDNAHFFLAQRLATYMIALCFAIVGSLCLFSVWKKKKNFSAK